MRQGWAKAQGLPRRTEILQTEENGRRPKGDLLTVLAPAEEVVVAVSALGDIKRVPVRSYQRGETEGVRPGDPISWILETNTRVRLILLFEDGHMASIPVRDLPDLKWRDPGVPLIRLREISGHGSLRGVLPVDSAPQKGKDTGATPDALLILENGMVRRFPLTEQMLPKRRNAVVPTLPRSMSSSVQAVLLTGEGDRLALVTRRSQVIVTQVATYPSQGAVAGGVRAIHLGTEDRVTSGCLLPEDTTHIVLVGKRGSMARVPVAEFPVQRRGGKGVQANFASKRLAGEEPVAILAQTPLRDTLEVVLGHGHGAHQVQADCQVSHRGALGHVVLPPDAFLENVERARWVP